MMPFQSRCLRSFAAAAPAALLTALTALILGDNIVGGAGAEALALGRCHLSQLAFLRLSDNDIGAAGAAALAPALGHLAALTLLDLSGNALGPDGAEALAPALHLCLESDRRCWVARCLEESCLMASSLFFLFCFCFLFLLWTARRGQCCFLHLLAGVELVMYWVMESNEAQAKPSRATAAVLHRPVPSTCQLPTMCQAASQLVLINYAMNSAGKSRMHSLETRQQRHHGYNST